MSRPRKSPGGYVTLIVEPEEDFRPINWQQTPTKYRVVEFKGSHRLRGQADAWKFLHNQTALRQGDVSRWGILVSMGPDHQPNSKKTPTAESNARGLPNLSVVSSVPFDMARP